VLEIHTLAKSPSASRAAARQHGLLSSSVLLNYQQLTSGA